MTIDQLQTIYRRDYSWPNMQVLRSTQKDLSSICECECRGKDDNQFAQNKHGQEQGWSRLGPMGPLIDPQLYPAHVSDAPEAPNSRYNQPNVFLAKLQELYPLIFDCNNKKPDDYIARINRDRLRSTYQVDFCKNAPLTFEELVRAGGASGLPPCPPPRELPGDPCKPYKRPIAFRPGLVSKRVGGGNLRPTENQGKKAGICIGVCRGTQTTLGITEYQDTISKLGQKVMMEKKKGKK